MNRCIREASLDDAEELRGYATRLFAEGLPGIYELPAPTLEEEVAFIRSYVDMPRSTLLAATVGGRIAGLLGLQGRQLPQERHVGVMGVSVDQRHRGRGIGTALISALFEWAPRNSITRIECEAFAANPRAIELYDRLGFEREGVRRGAVIIGGEPVDSIMFARILAATPESP